jgi:serine/threonine protein kinase
MTLLGAGTRLGPYEIVSPLGAGGMGEVYRARDTKLDRDVAVKVLPEALATDPAALARFEREAKAVAALSHPNILAIFDFGTERGVAFAVTELLEGQTLRDRLAAGALPPRKATEIALQIAHGLAAAHEKGIIHRDLKPENVFVAPNGRVKILDFGLAKAAPLPAAGGATMAATGDQTTPGTVLGTVGYMSPEQITGAAVDHRTDIFAFGAIVYEMLTGRRAFRRDSTAETIAAILKEDPPELTAAAALPPALDRIVRRCLEKNPAERFHSAHDIGIALEALTDRATSSATAAVPRPWARSIGRFVPWGIAALATAAAGAIWIARTPSVAPDVPVRKFHVPAKRLVISRVTRPVLSPDGRRIVFVSGDNVWIQELDQLDPRQLAASWRPGNLFWSPDSAFVAFVSENKLWKVPASGGQPIALADVPTTGGGAGGVWRADGKITFSRSVLNSGLLEVSQEGGELASILPLQPDDMDFHDPALLPGGNAHVFVVHHKKEGADNITVFSGQTRKQVFRLKGEVIVFPQYSPTGHIVFGRMGKSEGIWAVPFDAGRLETTGAPFLVATGGLWQSVSDDGTLTFIRRAWSEPRQLVILSRSGKVDRAIGEPQAGLTAPVLSPEGRRVAVAIGPQPNRRDLWVYDVERGGRSRLTFVETFVTPFAWTTVGDRVLFSRPDRAGAAIGTFGQPADGTGQADMLFEGLAPSARRDGQVIAFVRDNEANETAMDLYYLERDGREPKVFLERPRAQVSPQLSPDGRYIAYQSNESGRFEVYIKPFPGGAGQWQVSLGGGGEPRWSARGDKVWFRAFGNALMEVDVQSGPAFALGQPRELFKADPIAVDLTLGYEGLATGDRFVAVRTQPDPDGSTPSITVVQNWFAEFRNRR